jgi:hypothetical protein
MSTKHKINLKLQEIQSDVGFADGRILSCERMEANFIVRVDAWNSTVLRVVFEDVLLIHDLMPGDVSGLYVNEGISYLLKEALNYMYVDPPAQHPYKHFVFLNNDDCPCLNIVAIKAEVCIV